MECNWIRQRQYHYQIGLCRTICHFAYASSRLCCSYNQPRLCTSIQKQISWSRIKHQLFENEVKDNEATSLERLYKSPGWRISISWIDTQTDSNTLVHDKFGNTGVHDIYADNASNALNDPSPPLCKSRHTSLGKLILQSHDPSCYVRPYRSNLHDRTLLQI